jgi:beta-glucanase (GH16 family)
MLMFRRPHIRQHLDRHRSDRPGSDRHRRYRLPIALAAVAAVLLGTVVWRTAAGRSNWTTVWSDQFDGKANSPPSTQNWQHDLGTSYPGGAAQWGTGEVQTYTDDVANAALDGNGHLRITATRDAAGGWRSARLETTRADFRPAQGSTLKVEARIKMPDGGQGYWPAFWMLGSGFRGNYNNWPGIGEIDIAENIGREKSTVHGTLHCGVAPGGPCAELNGLTGARTQPDGSALSKGFHTFSVEWDRSQAREQLRWYLDGHLYFTVHADDVGATAWADATAHGFFVLLNVAVGGGWPGSPDATTRPGASMVVDYVSVARR